jgi:DNA-binding transcriptional LysR family regulator
LATIYYESIGKLIDEIEKCNALVKDDEKSLTGLMRVTTSVAFGKKCLIPKLDSFLKEHPSLTIDLMLSDERLDLVNDRIDIALRLGELPDSSMVARKLLNVSYSVLASPEFLKKNLDLQNPHDLKNIECILFPYSGYRDRWIFKDLAENIFEVPVRGRLFISSAVGIVEAALSGVGPALIADWLGQEEVKRGNLVPLFNDYKVTATSFDLAVWLMYGSKDFLPTKVRAFSDYLINAFNQDNSVNSNLPNSTLLRVA